MTAVLLTGPAVEPVTLDEAKAHLKVDHSYEDLLITSLITAARMHLELETRRVFITQTWLLILDAWPRRRALTLPVAPLQAVDSVTVYDDGDTPVIVDAATYFVDAASVPPRLVLRASGAWPKPGRAANGIEIQLTAGYGDTASDVPQPLRQALLLSIAHWYERRETVVIGSSAVPVPNSVAALIEPYRQVRL